MTVEFSITLLHKPIAWTQLKRSMADKLGGCYVGMGAVKTENSIRKSVRRTSSTTLALAKPVANISDVYDLGEQIGTGAFGTVRLARHKPTGSAQALKKLRRSKVSRQELQTQTAIMASMDHPHVIKLMGVVQDVGGDVFVAMELASGGDLFDHIRKARRFSEDHAAIVMRQVLSSVSYLHRCAVAHRDIKPENFVLSRPGPIDGSDLKLVDFDMACHCTPGTELTSTIGTPTYMSPQVAKGRYDLRCDVWSCGVVMYVLLRGRVPIKGSSDSETLAMVREGRWSFDGRTWREISVRAKQLVRSLLRPNPDLRTTAGAALCHPWIAHWCGGVERCPDVGGGNAREETKSDITCSAGFLPLLRGNSAPALPGARRHTFM